MRGNISSIISFISRLLFPERSIASSSSHDSNLNRLGPETERSIASNDSNDSNLNSLGPETSIAFSSSSNDSDSSNNNIRNYRYDVFISFRGPDTRNTFVDHLYSHLTRKGIFVFMDDKRLEQGDSISDQLLQAIKDSRVSIVVFSENYASSTWCLDEMAAIADVCKQQCSDQTVFPVFYDVDPSHARHQSGAYENAFVSHRSKFQQDPDKVHRWERTMTELANIAGWDIRHRPEFEQIEDIVQAVIKKLGRKFSRSVDDLIGIQPRVQALENLLKLDTKNDNFRVLGICGMAGIGKTTHAIILYDKISYKFSACCFIEDVSRVYRNEGVVAIHKQILRQTLDEKYLEIYGSLEISEIVRNRLHKIKVLIVLDNVDQLEQLQDLAINPKLLFKGSRIVITTTDEHILRVYKADKVHKVSLMNDNEASELFCRKAFKSEEETSAYGELIPRVLEYVQCLPLAIKVMGSFLYNRDVIQWRDALNRLENSPDNKIMNILQISVKGLEDKEKEIFLHIACFFKGEREDYVKRILDCCELNPHIGIPRLIENSLITIRNEEIHMHEMLQELGKKIIRDHSPEEPRSWSRIWLYKDFSRALTTETGTENVKAIVLDQKEDISECNVDGLSKMKKLTLLILYHKNFSGSLEFLSNRLQYLLWHDFPFASLPSYFTGSNLVELNMPNSRMKHVWEDRKSCPNLKRIDLSNSKFLIETPDFSRILNLERIDLSGCTNLTKVHPSIGFLKKLAFLNLQNCCNLDIIDFGDVTNMSSLRVLHLSGCTKLESTPDFTRATNLEYLDIGGCTTLSLVHESIGALANLIFLSLRDCKELESIPYNINFMASLQSLVLCGCQKLKDLPLAQAFSSSSHLKSLIFLDLGSCNLDELPDGIGELRCLERLNLKGNNFSTIPSSINGLYRLAYLNLSFCRNIKYLPNFSPTSDSSGGRYFKMVSGSRDHRSGIYLFNCPILPDSNGSSVILAWLIRLVKEPCHFRCGFDIVVPWHFKDIIPRWLTQRFKGDTIIRIKKFNMDDNWIGFAFGVIFKHNNHPDSISSSHPFYLSFEGEHTEEYFDMPHDLDMNKNYGQNHLWIIYISRQHCHFVKTGAHISFKALPHLKIIEWGMRCIFKQDIEDSQRMQQEVEYIVDFDYVKKSNNNSSKSKLQLPYNWWIIEEEVDEKMDAKAKEINLSHAGF